MTPQELIELFKFFISVVAIAAAVAGVIQALRSRQAVPLKWKNVSVCGAILILAGVLYLLVVLFLSEVTK